MTCDPVIELTFAGATPEGLAGELAAEDAAVSAAHQAAMAAPAS